MEKKDTFLMYGLITAVVMIAISTLIMYSGNTKSVGLPLLVYIPFIAGIILNAVAYSKANDAYVTFGNVFGSCFKAVLVIMALRMVWVPVSDHMFPAMKEKIFAKMQEQFSKNKGMSEDQAETIYNWLKQYWVVVSIISVCLSTLFWGALISLIAAAVAKKEGTAGAQIADF